MFLMCSSSTSTFTDFQIIESLKSLLKTPRFDYVSAIVQYSVELFCFDLDEQTESLQDFDFDHS